MAKIENIDQLRSEISRLRKLNLEQENAIRKDFADIQEGMKPINILLKGVSAITGVQLSKNAFLKDGILYGLSLLFQRFVSKTEKKAEETVHKVVDVIFDKIQNFIGRHTGHESKREQSQEEKQRD